MKPEQITFYRASIISNETVDHFSGHKPLGGRSAGDRVFRTGSRTI